MKTLFTPAPGKDGRRHRLTTNPLLDHREKYRILLNGRAAPYFLAVPYSMMRWEHNRGSCTIKLGSYLLRLNHKPRTVEGFIPDAWLVELGEPVDESEGTS